VEVVGQRQVPLATFRFICESFFASWMEVFFRDQKTWDHFGFEWKAFILGRRIG
jgi:hypothetical protein